MEATGSREQTSANSSAGCSHSFNIIFYIHMRVDIDDIIVYVSTSLAVFRLLSL